MRTLKRSDCVLRRNDGVELEGSVMELPEKMRSESVFPLGESGFLLPNFYDGSVSLYDVDSGTLRVVVEPTGKMVLGVAAYNDFVFVAGGEENPALRVYNARSGSLVVQRDALPNALVNDVIADQSYAYYTDSNNPVVYRLDYRAFVAEHSGEDGGRAGREGGGDGENSAGVDAVLQIAMPEESFRKKSKKACANGIALYAGGVVVSNSDTRTLYFIEPPSERDSTTRPVYAIMPEGTLPAADGLFIEPLSTGTSDASIYISQPKDNSISRYTLTTTTATAADGSTDSHTKVEARFVEQYVCDDFVTPTSIALLNDVLAAPNFNLNAPFSWKPGQSFSVVLFRRRTAS